jgi:signal transduction histidine kinase
MTGIYLLDWAIISVSIFNAILLVWLGLTVLLNADRRTWAVWVMGFGLLAGAVFFVSHTSILGHRLLLITSGLNLWWQIGWIPVIVAPLAWYVVSLWYAGIRFQPDNQLYRRHRFLIIFTCVQAVILVGLMLFTRLIPTYSQMLQLDLTGTPTFGGVPILFIIFPIFMVVCVLLSIDALRHSVPSERLMGDLARKRSRPWLMGTGGALLVVSVLVAFFIGWIVSKARGGTLPIVSIRAIGWFDLSLAGLISLAIIMLGQAVVSYEVFTGKALPRRGFFRHWRNTILLAAGYAILIGWSLTAQVRPIYSLMLTALLMVVFYALFSWRSFVEREQFMARLRPFVSSQRLMNQLVDENDAVASRASELFQAICQNVLGTDRALLMPLGILASLAGSPLAYPAAAKPRRFSLPPRLFSETGSGIVALDTAAYDGLQWAIPLWAERGLVGALLIGAKRDGGLYTEEEVQVAGASGERIVDMMAGEQIARRLMELQRKRLVENRVMDLRTRRALHDETLPTLHTAVLRLSSLSRDEPAIRDAISSLTEAHQQVADLIHTAHSTPVVLNGQRDLVNTLQAMIASEFAGEFHTVSWKNEGGTCPDIEPLAQETILGAVREALRNAATHGRGDRLGHPLSIVVQVECLEEFAIVIQDNGVGLDHPSVHKAGSGGGLALHSTMLAIVGGYLNVEPSSDGGTKVTISLPI